MNPADKESKELERRMRIAMQKAGHIIPTDISVDEDLPAEAMEVQIPESLSDIDAAMAKILGEEGRKENNVVNFVPDIQSTPFALAARNGEMKLSEETLNKLKRK